MKITEITSYGAYSSSIKNSYLLKSLNIIRIQQNSVEVGCLTFVFIEVYVTVLVGWLIPILIATFPSEAQR